MHYACRCPSLAIIIETLSDRLADPICLNDHLQTACQLVPYSHLTSKKSILIHELDRCVQNLYQGWQVPEDRTPLAVAKEGGSLDMLDEFDDIGKDQSPHCQIPRDFPSKNKFVNNGLVRSLKRMPSTAGLET